ncbi:MAG TPA: hypothetical protein VKZ63_10225, partial [Kofleriaceae bacterium]|nr:hypothetical protein [Kofleriaceae bacterium]
RGRMQRTCRIALAASLPLAALALPAGPAAAQPSVAPAEPVVTARAEPERRLGVGLHLGGMGLSPDEDRARKTELGGGGLHVRYRIHRRWDLQLELSHFQGEVPGAMLHRHSSAVALGAMFHFNPGSDWLWSGLVGLGGTRDDLTAGKDREEPVARLAGGLFRVGVGLERRFDRIGVAAQLYAVGHQRNDEELDGPTFAGGDGPVPARSSGGLFQLAASYYF